MLTDRERLILLNLIPGIGSTPLRRVLEQGNVLIFDEPTSSLDPTMVREVLSLIEAITREHRTILLVTHEIRFAQKVATRIIFMDQGKIAVNTTDIGGFFDAPPTPAAAEFLKHVHHG